ncbi:hypothetical protein NIES4106_06360 [Fischerella sp. NIES-4106]|jgi:hypothetical protein|nr:hypothetical protein NIES4106_06360 [Fischerella sp. NIES-4106]
MPKFQIVLTIFKILCSSRAEEFNLVDVPDESVDTESE